MDLSCVTMNLSDVTMNFRNGILTKKPMFYTEKLDVPYCGNTYSPSSFSHFLNVKNYQ